jgi:exodeoxyribonuclease V gamma subunit
MGEWLKLKLAEKRGISGDNPYVLPEKAMRELAEGYTCVQDLLGSPGSELPVLYMDNLKIRLYKILEDLFSIPEKIPASCRELYSYISSVNSVDKKSNLQIRSSRLYELADSIAGLFSHYGMNSLPLLEAWEENHSCAHVPGSLKKHEDWQRYLWERVYDGGLSLSRILRSIENSTDVYKGDAKRIVLFGSSFLGDTALKFFYRLSSDIQVDHFILTPSKIYSDSPVQLENPLLESWCTQMDGFSELAAGFEMKAPIVNYPVLRSDSILHKMQIDILENKAPVDGLSIDFSDKSLSIHGCTSPWREVEVLKDQLLGALNDDETLQLTDIAVLAPDINVYAPFIEALFPSDEIRSSIPYNLIDLDSSGMSPLIQGFLHIFTLPGSRFSRTDLFALFDNPCFREAHRMSRLDRESWLELCEELNIKWGFDRDHKSSFYKGTSDYNSWERAFERIREGLFLDEEDSPETLPHAAPDDETGRSWGNLMLLIQNLYHDLFELDRISMSLEQWVLFAESILESYFKVRKDERQDEADWVRLKGCFRDILNMAEETSLPGDSNFDFFVFRTLLSEYIRKSSGVKGRYLTQGITCSSLKPMRAIPFRKIFILGMNENTFPGEDEALSFDLKDTVPQSIDLSRRGGDRYAFLETVLSAGESLTLFYKNRDTIRGEVLQPSVLISELLDYLAKSMDDPETLLFHQESIHSFDPSYFIQPDSFNSTALEAARVLELGDVEKSEGMVLLRKDPPSEKREEAVLRAADILSFMKNPAAWYFKKVLHIYPEDEESPELDSSENRELPFLERYSYYDQILRTPGSLEDQSGLKSFVREQQIRGNLPEHEIVFLEEERLELRLNEMREQGERIHLNEDWEALQDILIDPERQSGGRRADGLLPTLIVPQLRRALITEEGGEIFLTAVLESLCKEESENSGRVWKTVEYCESGTPSARHSFNSYLKFLFLSAIDGECRELKLQRIGKRDYPELRFCAEGENESNLILLDRPLERLDRLISFCINPETEIIPLYPELGESLAADLNNEPQMDDAELERRWRECWLEQEGKSSYGGGGGTFQRCPYRSRFLKTPPAVNPVLLRELLELIYLPIIRAKGKSRG